MESWNAVGESGLPKSWSLHEVCSALHVSRVQVGELIGRGVVGYYRAGRSKRFLAEHVEQLIKALEVAPRLLIPDGPLSPTNPDYYLRLGLTQRSAVLRSRRAMRELTDKRASQED